MDLVLFVLSFVVILAGCEFFTNGVEWLGKRYNLSEGCIGSVLAAVGTAMPETLIPLIAIIFVGGDAGQEIGVGAILGAPFMLSTLALFVCGLSVFLFVGRRKTRTLHINGKLIRRDLRFFLIAYSLAVVAALLPSDFAWFRWVVGASLIPLYVIYTYKTVKRGECSTENHDVKDLYLDSAANKVRRNGRKNNNQLNDPMTEAFRKTVYKSVPPTYLIFTQVLMGLMAIILGADLFVGQVNAVASDVGLSPLILALLLAPIATELPEKFNSVLWIRDRKDTYAIGNITGAMVFQSSIPVTIGILLTDWHIDLWNGVQFLQACSIGIALLSASVLYLKSTHKELHMSGLMLGGALYLLFFMLVMFSI
jgi:cation:H+ antiporter